MFNRKLKVSFVFLAVFLCLVLTTSPLLSSYVIPPRTGPITGEDYMVVSNNHITSMVGQKILADGGNAVDAAVAMGINKGLVEPWISGPGGSAFAMYFCAETEEIHYLNYSGRSPADLSLDDFPDGLPYRCPKGNTALVPVMFKGWEEMRERFGTMSREELYGPTIDMAINGFPNYPALASRWEEDHPWGDVRDWFQDHDGLGYETWWGGSTTPPELGETVTNPNMGESLKRIAEEGIEVFYGGELGQEFVDFLQDLGSVMTIEDLENATVDWQEPIETTYRDFELFMAPPNCSGGVAIAQILNILEGFDIEGMGFNSAEYVHSYIEATKLAVEDRAEWVSDPDFYPAPLDVLTSKEYAEERRALIDPNEAAMEVSPGKEREGGTTSYAVIDKDGNMVSVVQSNGGGHGSNLIVGETGIHINNGVAWMEDDPESVNVVEGNKRSRWNMTPVIAIKDGEPAFVLCASGGTAIWQALSQFVTKIVDFEMDPQEAQNAPHHRYMMEPTLPIRTEYLSDEVIEVLEDKGHLVDKREIGAVGGNVNAIVIDRETGVYYGSINPRTQGFAVGF